MKTDTAAHAEIGILERDRDAVSKILDTLLADEYMLYTKTRNFHWNVSGPDFSELHKFFEGQYEALDGIIDEVAERIRALGEKTPSTLAAFLKTTRLKEFPGQYQEAKKMLLLLLEDHEEIINVLREDLKSTAEKFSDMGTSDFLTGLMEQHEKMAWMLRAHLE